MKWSAKSLERRKGVHPDLLSVCDKALSYGEMDITVLPDGGVRTPERQAELVAKGVSKTLLSKHLPQADGYGHAIDVAPYPVDWKNIDRFIKLAKLMKRAAAELGVEVEHGGDWKNFKDWPHWQLRRTK
jgi:peptidoglycan L-alanyl-D-glutamate endopeptidase CwlK